MEEEEGPFCRAGPGVEPADAGSDLTVTEKRPTLEPESDVPGPEAGLEAELAETWKRPMVVG